MEATDLADPLTSFFEYFPQPPSPADATQADPSKTQTVKRLLQFQGTIAALKHIQQIDGLAPVSGLQSLDRVVLNILVAEVVNVSFSVLPGIHLACKILTLSI